MVTIAPSILSADFSFLRNDVDFIRNCRSVHLHVDVMDGHFVPAISFGPLVFSCLRENLKVPFDVHLMVDSPRDQLSATAKAGADIISVHEEVKDNKISLFQEIKSMGKKVGIAYNPDTSLESLESYLPYIDQVLIMSVVPGLSGQRFLEDSLSRVRYVKDLLKKNGVENLVKIEVDGGINLETGMECIKAGANILVMGSALFSKPINQRLDLINKLSSC